MASAANAKSKRIQSHRLAYNLKDVEETLLSLPWPTEKLFWGEKMMFWGEILIPDFEIPGNPWGAIPG